jgi:hypothetical protein
MSKAPVLTVVKADISASETPLEKAKRQHLEAARSAEGLASDALVMARDAADALAIAGLFPSLSTPFADRLKKLATSINAELQSIEAQRLRASQ